jgi:hypothetical protein
VKANLRDHTPVKGISANARNVEVASVDWEKRVVWLPNGQWIPFENVSIGDPPPAPPPAPAIVKGGKR